VDVIVHWQLSNHQINEQFNLPCSVPVALAPVPPLANSHWNGILLITIRGENNAQDAGMLFERWQPLIAIIALPSTLSRFKRNTYSSFNKGPFKQDGYKRRDIKIFHSSVGGMTESEWHFVHLNRLETELSKEAVMMAPQFLRPLQTALDDTRGPVLGRKVVFEARSCAPLPQNITGYVTIPRLVH
jgi:hypothetical protein